MLRTLRDDAGEGNWTPFHRALERPFYKVRWPKVK